MELEAQDAEFERLYDCPEGCGRNFKREALEKHIKVCKSVFQKKVENSKIRGASVAAKIVNKQDTDNPYERKGEQAKQWKKDSENFRNMIKGKAPIKEINILSEENLSENVCDVCSRSFTDDAYLRHKPLCQSKKKYLQKAS